MPLIDPQKVKKIPPKKPVYLSGDIFYRFDRLIAGIGKNSPLIVIQPETDVVRMYALGEEVIVCQQFDCEHSLSHPITLPYTS